MSSLNQLALLLLQDTSETPSTGEGGAASPFLIQMLPFIAIFAIFWFLLIRPEQKNRQKRQKMIEAMKKGDRVMTQSGLYGTVTQIHEGVVTLQVADGVRLKFAQSAVQQMVEEEK